MCVVIFVVLVLYYKHCSSDEKLKMGSVQCQRPKIPKGLSCWMKAREWFIFFEPPHARALLACCVYQ